jgi:hypothetical protein
VLVVPLLRSRPALAEPPLPSTDLREVVKAMSVGVGLRIGGYGYREIENDGSTRWLDCRMDGVGAFATLTFKEVLFGELSLDYYQATGGTVSDERMDRLSIHTLAAIGLRAFPSSWIHPIVQVGVGAEFTEVEWIDQEVASTGVYPMGFVGGGAEVEVGDHARLGLNLRLFMMAGFAPRPAEDLSGADALEASGADPEAAAQVQLWARYEL